jgi:hypothetical protein
MAPEMKGGAAIMRMWLSTDSGAPGLAAAGAGAVEPGRVLLGDVRAPSSVMAPHVLVGGVDVLPESPDARAGRTGIASVSAGLQRLGQNLAERPAVEGELERLPARHRAAARVGEALGLERAVIDGGRLGQRAWPTA